jgi:hypothetical protein
MGSSKLILFTNDFSLKLIQIAKVTPFKEKISKISKEKRKKKENRERE